ncbi:hypothetical protein [Ileibacterium valens]|uniref:hypothetical protein n=1 Tax=Ileibacterium valens TaxID=1862668 RepID=UPI002357D9C6|nr:hypothetical protein [Ileibacterium valens]
MITLYAIEQLSPDELKTIGKEAVKRMETAAESLREKAGSMEEKDLYGQLIDYAEEKIKNYLASEDTIKSVLTNPHNIENAFNEMTSTPEFEKIGTEEHRRLPRVVMMMLLAGAEANAADAALSYIRMHTDKNPAEFNAVEKLVEIYNGYFRDALEYGKGNDKKLTFTGEKQ